MNKRYPRYPDDADYQTNAPSYYEDLARKQKLIEMLAKKIWEYENTLNETLEQIEQRLTDYILENDSLMSERLENWDQRIEEMPEEMRSLFVTWLNDGTLEQIINHDVLGNKADQSELDKTNELLAQTVKMKIVTNYGVIGDGVTDNTEPLQTLLDEGGSIYFPNGTYFFKAVNITKDNTKIYFAENVVLKTDHMKNSNHFGAINILGAKQESFTGISDLAEGDITVPVSSGFAGEFVDGGYVYLVQQNPSVFNDNNLEDRYHRTVARVLKVENNQLILDNPLPHTFNIDLGYTVTKFEPIKNIELIGNVTTIDNMGVVTNGAFINANYNEGLIVDGFHLTNGSGRAVYVTRGINFKIRNIKHSKTLRVDAGYGYGITIESGSCHGIIEYFEAYDSRHGVDIGSGSNNILIQNGDLYRTNVNGHGQNTKHITVDHVNCYDNETGISIGVFTYGKDMNWTINNVHGENVTRLVSINAGSSDVSITNISIDGMSNTLLYVNYGYNIVLDNGYAIDAFKLFNLTNNAKNVRISNVFAIDKDRLASASRSGILFGPNSENITIDNVHIQGNYYDMLTFNSDSIGHYSISNSTFIHEYDSHSINMNNAKDLSLVNNVIDGTIISTAGLGPYYIINNKINGSIDIREATVGMIVGNYGDFVIFNPKEPYPPKFIVKDNITSE